MRSLVSKGIKLILQVILIFAAISVSKTPYSRGEEAEKKSERGSAGAGDGRVVTPTEDRRAATRPSDLPTSRPIPKRPTSSRPSHTHQRRRKTPKENPPPHTRHRPEGEGFLRKKGRIENRARGSIPGPGGTKERKGVVKRKKVISVRCRNRPKFGRYCIGRVVGPLVRDEVVKCPLCGGAVLVRRLLRPWPSWHYDSDLRPFSNKRYRQVHRVWTCRKCGYSSLSSDFFKPFPRKKVLQALQPLKKNFEKYSQIPPEYRFQTAAAVYWARGKDAKFFAEFFLRAVWAMREEKRPEKERAMFASRAISALKVALKKKLYSKSEEPRALYLLAELYRQLGKFYRAKYYLERAILSLEKNRDSLNPQQVKVLESYISQVQTKILNRDPRVFTLK